jgi:hypothetical protein
MKRLALALLLASCGPVTVSSIAYTTACPQGDKECEIRQNAETLYYLGHPDASLELMCGTSARSYMNEHGDLCSLY